MNWDEFNIEMEKIGPSSLAAHLDRERPYDGQPHTDYGKRGETKVEGLTYRDVRDCFVRACFSASGLPPEEWPSSIYNLPWDNMDIIAVAQNLAVWMEKYQGIYPNVERPVPVDPTRPHWCGPNLDTAVWRSHLGECKD